MTVILWLAATAVGSAGAVVPAITGPDASVAVNRDSGEVAVLRDRTLVVIREGTPLDPVEVAFSGGRILEFRGSSILIEFSARPQQGIMRAVVSPRGRERLAWPNPGVGVHFPHLETVLTLDGRGLMGSLTLDDQVRAELGGLEGIPAGAGVVATYRFRGGLVGARASERFGPAAALTPDDFVVFLRGGGALRYRAPEGVVWSVDTPSADLWRPLDVDPGQGAMLVRRGSEWEIVSLESGQTIWRLEETARARAVASFGNAAGVDVAGAEGAFRDGRLLRDGRILVLGGAAEAWLGVLDPKTGRLAPVDILRSLGHQGGDSLREFWLERRPRLEWVQELPQPGGSVLLVRGPDGWYTVPIPETGSIP